MADRRDQENGLWPDPVREPDLPAEELERWREASRRVRAIATREGWIRSEVARRSDIPAPTFSMWLDGTYTGSFANQTARLVKWLDAYDATRTLAAQLPEVPGWVPTPTSVEIEDTLRLCQLMPDMALVTIASGLGKTLTAKHYVETRPSAYLVTMRPSTASVTTMLRDIAEALDLDERNPFKLDRAIGQRLKRNGRQTLLIVDEAQNLVDKAVDQLRFILDEYECGIALLGNNELYSRFGKGSPKEGYGQIHRRIGKRLIRLRPLAGDIDAIIGAWKVEEPAIQRLLKEIGRKPGALGQITKTMQLAAILAAGDEKPIDDGHVRKAWENRGGEEGWA